ncbi:hypothetical protein R3W88_021078 [Solanum pinnatisectum]|uniref:FBD domain-containing protein n=1 Tax=Solanum pinnatisectum TaxID=50273 RepID=A0AAV9LUC5_9SOLN|nr:hypothetical protein R3W88_021078 [Solanum pinnatisectum]
MSLSKIEEVSGAVYLITSCPKLQDLTIEFKLQRVQVNLFMGLEMEMKFMKFILASAPVLKEISILNFAYLLHRSDKQMMDEMK